MSANHPITLFLLLGFALVNVESGKRVVPPIFFNEYQPAVSEFDILVIFLPRIVNLELVGLSTSSIRNFTVYLPQGTFHKYLGCRTLGEGVFKLEGSLECLTAYSDLLRYANEAFPAYNVYESRVCNYSVEYRNNRCPSTSQKDVADTETTRSNLISPDPAVIPYDGSHTNVAWAMPITSGEPRTCLVFDFNAVYEVYGVELNIETVPITFEVLLVSGPNKQINPIAVIKQSRQDCNDQDDCYIATIQENRLRTFWIGRSDSPVQTSRYAADRVVLRLGVEKSYGEYATKYYAIRGARWLARKIGEIEGERTPLTNRDILNQL